MPFVSGTRLGPYEILSPLGAGGMGEVWRARDTRLDRSVAIKILPVEMVRNAESRLRLEREAKTISQMSHPHICALYDVGQTGPDSSSESMPYLVMELLEGETLAERLARGRLPLSEVLRFGTQIAEALSAAHAHGVVHRDLKPGNVMITRTGAKLLDFGLAKASPLAPTTEDVTAQKPITQEGTIVGTFQYMAPEQITGQDSDARADIFALGAVLYEMATGRRAFEGKTRTSVMAAIVSAEPPPMSSLVPLAPAQLEHVVQSCLAKDPQERMQSAQDVALELRWIAGESGVNRREHSTRRERMAWIVAAVLAAALLAGFAAYRRVMKSQRRPSMVRLTIPAPPLMNIERAAAISPDGRRIVFRARDLGQSRLYLRELDSLEARPLPGTEGSFFAFWSPDARHIGFFARNKLLRLDTVDNSIRTIFEPTEGATAGATWNAGDVIVFSRLTEGPLMRVPAGGGEATPATHLGPNESIHAWPHFLPDGRHFLLSVVAAKPADGGIFVASLDSKERKRLLPFQKFYDVTPVYYGGDHLFYLRNRALLAQRFDPEALEIRGDPVVVDEGLEVTGPSRTPLSVSRNGTVVYRRFGEAFVDQLMFVDRQGRELGTVGEVSSWARARVSPDGRRVAAAKYDSTTAVWILEADRGTATRATFEEWASLPAWMPDGKSILYSGSEDSPPNIYLRRSDGIVTRITQASEQHYVGDVSPDGRFVICTVLSTSVNSDLFAVPIQPPHTAVPLLRSRFDEGDGAVSPDGKWLAFRSNESGRNEVYVTTFPETGNKWQISVSGGNSPRWSRDGGELYFFESGQKQILSASIAASDGEIRAGVPLPLLAADSPLYDVAGKNRFLIGRSRLNGSAPGLTVVVNWQR